jgi:Peptidase family M48
MSRAHVADTGSNRKLPAWTAQLSLAAFALLGQAFVLVLALAAVASAAGLFFLCREISSVLGLKVLLHVGLPLLAFVGVALAGLWVRLPRPEGIPLERRDAPGLWTMIAEMERDLRTPRIDRVHLTDKFNAAIGHYPRVGLLGWHYSVLFLGMPWLLASSPDRIRAVIAHELAHLSRKHDWTTRLVWRARASAARVEAQLRATYPGSLLPTALFFNWYRPALERRAMALSRAQEFEADRLAAEVAGSDLVGQALLELRICDDLLDDQFWPEIGRRYQSGETCPENIFQELRRFLAAGLDLSPAQGRSEAALAERSDPWSSHPSLAERLDALGFMPQVPALRSTASAASCFLEDRLDHYLGRLSVEWRKHCAAAWEAQAQRMREARTELSVLERTKATRALETRELARLAELRELLHGSGAGIRQDLELLERDPDHRHASWRVARAALEAGHADGLSLILRSMQLEWQTIPTGISAIRDAAAHGIIELSPRAGEPARAARQGLRCGRGRLERHHSLRSARAPRPGHGYGAASDGPHPWGYLGSGWHSSCADARRARPTSPGWCLPSLPRRIGHPSCSAPILARTVGCFRNWLTVPICPSSRS